MRHGSALSVAESLVEHLRPACTRIEIKGSLVRCKPDVHDIDVVAIPKLEAPPYPRAEFGGPKPKVYPTLIDKLIGGMVDEQAIQLLQDGPRKKQLWLNYAGIHVELWLVLPPASWGVAAVIRTGPAEFSNWIVTQRSAGGGLPNGYFVKHQVVWDADEIQKRDVPDDPNKAIKVLNDMNHVAMPEEKDFLEFCHLGWIEPKDRVAKWIAR